MAKKTRRVNWKNVSEIRAHEISVLHDRAVALEGFAHQRGEELMSLTGTVNDLRLRNRRGAMQLHAAAEQLETLNKVHAAALLHTEANDLASS